jgi:hypothetical protein
MQDPRLGSNMWKAYYQPIVTSGTAALSALGAYHCLVLDNYWLNRFLTLDKLVTKPRWMITHPKAFSLLYEKLDRLPDPDDFEVCSFQKIPKWRSS